MSRTLRSFVSILPNFVSIILGQNGLTYLVKRSPDLNFKARLYGTEYFINVRGDYAVERLATQRKAAKKDPFRGLKRLPLSGLNALDVGANVGTISIGLAALGAKRVFSIEPGPLSGRLLQNVELNSLGQSISLHKVGLSSKKSELFWAEDKNNPGNAHLVSSENDINFGKISTKFSTSDFIRVPVITLDDFVIENSIEDIGLIKIDVEGMEWEVIKGGVGAISKNLPFILVETHRVSSDMMGHDFLTPMFYFFYELGYKSYSLNDDEVLLEFIYPNFEVDTFFIHPNSSFGKSRADVAA